MSVLSAGVCFAAAALTGLGVGSGGLYLCFLTLIAGVEQRAAQGMNLLFCLCALAAGTAVNLFHRRLDLRLWLFLLLCGLPGAAVGAALAGAVTVALLRRGLGLMLLGGGAAVLWRGVVGLLAQKKGHGRKKSRPAD